MDKVNTIKRGGSRYYVEPSSGVKVPGVTSVVSMLPKPFLQHWAARMAAEYAVDNLKPVTALAEADRVGAIELVKGAARRYTKSRQDVGSDAHDMFERMIRGEQVRRVGLELEPYRKHFAEFLEAVKPRLLSAEDVMWSDTHNYAGSSDAILQIWDDEADELMTVIVDWKTGKDAYPDVALQLAAYAHADRIVTAAGDSRPMPEIHAGAVLHITPERWEFKPVNIDADVFADFLALRRVFDWDRDRSRGVLGPWIARGGRLVTGTERRA